MRRLWIAVLIAVAIALPAAGADGSFESLVNRVEQQCNIRRSHPHLLGFGLFMAKPITWFSGVHEVKLAIFEGERLNAQGIPGTGFDRIISQTLGPDWHPIVRVQSRREHGATIIYASCSGKHMRMLIATAEPQEFTMIHAKIGEGPIKKWLADPQDEARGGMHRHQDYLH